MASAAISDISPSTLASVLIKISGLKPMGFKHAAMVIADNAPQTALQSIFISLLLTLQFNPQWF
jgi:hypothetical protein